MKRTCLQRFSSVLLAATALGFLPAAPAQSVSIANAPPPQPRRPSIIFIQCDGLGWGDLSCYGQTKFQTPNLDRLAAGGIRFTSYYAGDAASSPAGAALLLGRETTHLKQRADGDVPLAADEITVAQRLQQTGYHTVLIGEWFLGGDGTSGAPWRKGFDEFAGYLDPGDTVDYYADYIWHYAPARIPSPDHPVAFQGRETLFDNADGKKGEYIPDLLAKATGNFIKTYQPDQFNGYRPFFLLLNYTIARPGTGNTLPVPTDAPYSDESWPQPEKNRAAMIARFDGYVGQLLEELKNWGIESNTVIFFSSDTGPQTGGGVNPKFFQSAGPFRGERGGLYEGGLRVPMIVSWPGTIRPGQVSDFPWAAWDFLPTALQIALREPPPNLDGFSVLPTLLGEPQTNRHELLSWELRGRETAQAARMADWKIVRSRAGEKWELYNLKTDPGETRDVADKNPAVIAKFEELLKK
ncbi:MAG TPA: sulfatase-like hydrolase/transferase [Verrucomicrobiae bacterium]|nr:sulfatase-like hydrolase/transferase [Verrucomicrobiae bacterium]